MVDHAQAITTNAKHVLTKDPIDSHPPAWNGRDHRCVFIETSADAANNATRFVAIQRKLDNPSPNQLRFLGSSVISMAAIQNSTATVADLYLT